MTHTGIGSALLDFLLPVLVLASALLGNGEIIRLHPKVSSPNPSLLLAAARASRLFSRFQSIHRLSDKALHTLAPHQFHDSRGRQYLDIAPQNIDLHQTIRRF